jgi:hypothetical protein
MKELSDSNPPKDLVVRKGSDVSIGNQPEEKKDASTSVYGNI